MDSGSRDHLFISYAYEDEVLAEWLARKLTSEGYRVWCDRFKLLGGESYPRDIDIAIKDQTFRFLALLSRHSIAKPNPTKERTLALNLGRLKREDFVIPLNVDGLMPTELDWMTNDLTFIRFDESWAVGLRQLLKKLNALNAPRTLTDGRASAAETYLTRGLIERNSEVVYTNQLRLLRIPPVIRRFRFERALNHDQRISVSQSWPAMFMDHSNALAFRPPTSLPTGLAVVASGERAWKHHNRIGGVLSEHVIVWLLKRELIDHCIKKGLLPLGKSQAYFPSDFNQDGKLFFSNWEGRRTWIQVTGQRSAWRANKPPQPYLYHLMTSFSVNRKLNQDYNLQIRLGVQITDLKGEALPKRSAIARRKAICRSWWNDAWLKRLLAVCEFLSDSRDTIEIGQPGDEQIIISAKPITLKVPIALDESQLELIDPHEELPNVNLIEEDFEFATS